MPRLRRAAVALIVVALALTALIIPTAAQETIIEVELGSFYINMPETIPAGPLTLQVTNVANMPHTITIEGNGETMTMPETLVPAGPTSTTWEINLSPGTYTIWCPIGAHREQGMEITITVEGEDNAPEPMATSALEPTATTPPQPEPTVTTAPMAPGPTATSRPTEPMATATATQSAVDTSYLGEVADPEPTETDAEMAVAGDSDSDDGTPTWLLIAIGLVILAVAAAGGGLYYRKSNTIE